MADFLDIDSRYLGQEIDRAFYAGQETEFAFGRGETFFSRAPVAIYGMTASRIVEDAGKKHFEFGFTVDMTDMGGPLTGNAGAGWTDFGNYLKLEPQWSPDLVNWSMGKFYPAPVPVVSLPNNVYEFWGRAIHVQDAAVKNGSIRVSSGYNGQIGDIGVPDTRNNPITGITIAGAVQPFLGVSYTMPGDASALQARLRALGWTGATVEASSATVWRIIIPTVNFTSYSQTSKVFWPSYLVPDIFGNVVNPIDGSGLGGQLSDALGNEIFTRAFARLKISAGTRYDPYR